MNEALFKHEMLHLGRLYTTVTLADFRDASYIRQLVRIGIGFEVALTTVLSDGVHSGQIKSDLELLTEELKAIKTELDRHGVLSSSVRVHQPAGYFFDWSMGNCDRALPSLAVFLERAARHSFTHHVVHAPTGDLHVSPKQELLEFRRMLCAMALSASIEVEEVPVSSAEQGHNRRPYAGRLFEELLAGQKTDPLIDTHECGGSAFTLRRLEDLESKGFLVRTIHLHKDKHHFLDPEEYGQLRSRFRGSMVNEGFIRKESSFKEFLSTGSIDCVVPHERRVAVLKNYLALDETGAQATG